MKKNTVILMLLGQVVVTPLAHGEWVSLSKGLPETEIGFVAIDPSEPRTLYAAGSKRLYRLADPEMGWKQVLSLRGSETRIRFVLVDSRSPKTVYVASDNGLQKSEDSGKHWKWIYRGIGQRSRTVHCIAEIPADPTHLWLGTGSGIVQVSKDGRSTTVVDAFPDAAVHSIWISEPPSLQRLVSSSKGVYNSRDAGGNWERVLVESGREGPDGIPDTELSQFQIEELSAETSFSNLAFAAVPGKFLTASASGLFESGTAGSEWKRASITVPSHPVRYLAASSESFFAATGRGIFQSDRSTGDWRDLSTGLPSPDVRMIVFDQTTGDLYAATKNGVHRFLKPELKSTGPVPAADAASLLARFQHEPTILEIQQAAIRYAEVHPEKIQAWRHAAMRKAFLPTVSVGTDMGQNQNVDLDRGGTNDPDRFILGPEEESVDWHADLSWDLGDLIWNDDQTSIDTRSKLMVELREDTLNEVTHLYFERRRLQVDLVLVPPKELPLQIEKELKLQELTADIDALTGGFLTMRLSHE